MVPVVTWISRREAARLLGIDRRVALLQAELDTERLRVRTTLFGRRKTPMLALEDVQRAALERAGVRHD